MTVVDVLLAILGLPVLAAAIYLGLLTVASWRPTPPVARGSRWRFEVIVPAHNEEAGIGRTVRNLLAMDYPRELFRVVVVADNCEDETWLRAEEAGARVLVRHDRARRGKGFALAHAFHASQQEGFADAVVVVDADTVVSANLLRAFSSRLEQGHQALQAEYGVSNPDAGWRTRLMTLALALFHGVRSLGRENLGLSAGLRGNGMCFTTRLLREHPHRAFSVVEDVEYGLQLGEAGVRVAYVHEVEVLGEMVTRSEAARSQRVRWEAGRGALRRTRGWPLLSEGWRRRDPVRVDLALDLLVPPLTVVVAALGVGFGLAAAGWLLGAPGLSLAVWGASALLLTAHVLRGWALSGLGAGAVTALASAPAYMAWKLWTRLRSGRGAPAEWVRTAREG